MAENLIFESKWPIFLPKEGPKLAKKMHNNLNCFIRKETINLVNITKISKIISTDRKKMAKNHKQCIFNQKKGQKVKFQIFPGENFFAIFF